MIGREEAATAAAAVGVDGFCGVVEVFSAIECLCDLTLNVIGIIVIDVKNADRILQLILNGVRSWRVLGLPMYSELNIQI